MASALGAVGRSPSSVSTRPTPGDGRAAEASGRGSPVANWQATSPRRPGGGAPMSPRAGVTTPKGTSPRAQAHRRRRRATMQKRVKANCPSWAFACLYGSRESQTRGLLSRLRQPATVVVVLVVAASLLLSLWLAAEVQRAEDAVAIENRRTSAAGRVGRLLDALTAYERGLEMLGASVHAQTLHAASSGAVGKDTHEGFDVMAQQYLRSTSSTVGVGVVDRVPRALRAAYEANATRDFPERALPAAPDGDGEGGGEPAAVYIYVNDRELQRPVPARDEPYVYPLTYSSTSSSALYYDLVQAVEPLVDDAYSAVELCAATGNVTATIFAGSGYLLYARSRAPRETAGAVPGDGSDGIASLVVTGASAAGIVQILRGASPDDEATIHGHPLLIEIDDCTVGEKRTNMARDAVGDTTLEAAMAWPRSRQLVNDNLVFAARKWNVIISEEHREDDECSLDGAVLAIGVAATTLLGALLCTGVEVADRRMRQRQSKLRASIAATTHARLVSYICHELRNPLHHISGGLTLFLDDHLPIITGRMYEELCLLQQSVAQMVHVVNDILDIRKLEAGDIEVEIMGANVHSVVRDLAHQLRDSVRPDVALTTVVSRALPEQLLIDPMRMRQGLGNAVHNACKFTNEGTISIIVTTLCDDTALLLEVRNTGVGLKGKHGNELLGIADDSSDDDVASFAHRRESWASSSQDGSTSTRTQLGLELPPRAREELHQWFKKSVARDSAGVPRGPSLPARMLDGFSTFVMERRAVADDSSLSSWGQSSAGRTHSHSLDASAPSQALMTNASGFGLGLPLCRRVTEHMGGEIGLSDERGFTRFWVLLPVNTPGSQIQDEEGAAAEAKGEMEEGPPPVVAGRFVIAIDDERVLRKLLKRYLKALAVEFVVLEDGCDLAPELERCRKEGIEPACILMDIVMLRSDGVSVCRKMRASGVNTPIYAMTGNVDRSHTDTYRSAGFDGLLAKPFTSDGILNCLHHALREQRSWMEAKSETPRATPRLAGRPNGRPRAPTAHEPIADDEDDHMSTSTPGAAARPSPEPSPTPGGAGADGSTGADEDGAADGKLVDGGDGRPPTAGGGAAVNVGSVSLTVDTAAV
uniref:histidine kinase n=1 Tax=Bicosoecida sp. CB-2014 TaxID=1486930 RepID=A0A7S1G741_9STRA|mmetsp:Transcript_18061/g.63898  ORF Transcript_18061/g.63898 Transcript_18061/m.63898 type:complete len:1101 (+) Transcript_18061:349-3651(+)